MVLRRDHGPTLRRLQDPPDPAYPKEQERSGDQRGFGCCRAAHVRNYSVYLIQKWYWLSDLS